MARRLCIPIMAAGAAIQATAAGAQGVPQSQWPGEVSAAFQESAAGCSELDGARLAFSEETYVRAVELNGDGRPDYIVDDAGLECSGSASYFCGSAGCGVTVYLSGQRGYSAAWGGHLQGHIVIPGSPARIRTGSHGSGCGRVGADTCFGELSASGSRIVYRDMPRQRGMTGSLWMSGSDGWRHDAVGNAALIDMPVGNIERASVACVADQPALSLRLRDPGTLPNELRLDVGTVGDVSDTASSAVVLRQTREDQRTWTVQPISQNVVALLTGPAEGVALYGETLPEDFAGFDVIPLTGSTRSIRTALASCGSGGASAPANAGMPPAPPTPGGGDAAEVRALVTRLYDGYRRPIGDYGGDRTQFLTPALAQLEQQVIDRFETIAADAFCECQDYDNVSYAIREVLVRGDRAGADVAFTNFGETIRIRLILLRTPAGWRIDDVVSSASESYSAGLRADLQRR